MGFTSPNKIYCWILTSSQLSIPTKSTQHPRSVTVSLWKMDWCLEDDPFVLGLERHIFRGRLAAKTSSFRECIISTQTNLGLAILAVMLNGWPFSSIFPILKMRSKKTSQLTVRVLKTMWCLHPKSQAETLAVLDDKLEDVHLSAFQPCGKAWQAAITCTFGLEKKRHGGEMHILGVGFKLFFNFHPDPWGNDPIWLLFLYMGWNHQLLEYIMKCWVYVKPKVGDVSIEKETAKQQITSSQTTFTERRLRSWRRMKKHALKERIAFVISESSICWSWKIQGSASSWGQLIWKGTGMISGHIAACWLVSSMWWWSWDVHMLIQFEEVAMFENCFFHSNPGFGARIPHFTQGVCGMFFGVKQETSIGKAWRKMFATWKRDPYNKKTCCLRSPSVF